MSAGNVCDHCNFKYTLTPQNTLIYYFECQPWFSYGESYCPQCQSKARLFFRDYYDDYMEQFILEDFGFITEDFAPPETVCSFEAVYKVHELPEVYVNKRHELEIQNFHVVLANIPDDLLMHMLGAD